MGEGEANLVVVSSSTKAVPATVTSDDLVDASLHDISNLNTAKDASSNFKLYTSLQKVSYPIATSSGFPPEKRVQF